MDVIAIAHITGWSKKEILDMDNEEIFFWREKAVNFYNEINKVEDVK